MKASEPQLDRALKAPAEIRYFLFHGPDEAGSRALAKRIGAAMAGDAERVELTGADLKNDPARLSDEAVSIAMFGGARYIIVDPAGDETVAAVEALEDTAAACNPVALVAGTLRPTSKLLKLALASKQGFAFASYPPDGRKAEKLIADLGRELGLIVQGDVARRIGEGANGNRALIEQELRKLALYVDAAPERPRPLDHDALEAVGAATEEGDLSRLVAAVAGGDAAALRSELDRLSGQGISGIPQIRAVLRRLALLAGLRGEVDRGNSPAAVMASKGKSIFWRDSKAIEPELARWHSEVIAKAIDRLAEAERQVKASGGPGEIAADEELFAICRQAARLR